MNIFEKVLNELSPDTWTAGAMYTDDGGVRRRCLAGHLNYQCNGESDVWDVKLHELFQDSLLVLHEIISEQYPDLVSDWLKGKDCYWGAYPLTPWGLITYFNDRVHWRDLDAYREVRSVVEKAATR